MKVGDQKQAVVLSIVAVGAVAFMVMQLKGKGGSQAVAVNEVTTGNPGATPLILTELPKKLSGDPFYNPVLEKIEEEKEAAAKKAAGNVDPRAGDIHQSQDDLGNAPMLPDLNDLIGPMPSLMGLRAWKPRSKNPSTTAKKTEPTKLPNLEVQGVVSAGNPQALISIGGAAPLSFKPGAKIAPGVSLSKIFDNRVEILVTGRKAPVSLSVGSKLQP